MAFPDSDLQVKVYAYLGADPNADPSNWPSPVDLTDRLLDRDISVSLGRRQGQRTAAAGQCSFWLDNHDGALTPGVPTSPYYGWWDLGVPVALDVDGVGTSPPYGLTRGYVVEIRPEIIPTASGPTSAVKVTLGGILRRLGQGAVSKSALTRALTAVNAVQEPVLWWPLESEEDLGLALSPTEGPPGSAGAARFTAKVTSGAIPVFGDQVTLPRMPAYTLGTTTIFTVHVRQSFQDGPADADNVDNFMRFSVNTPGGAATDVAQLRVRWTGVLPTSVFSPLVSASVVLVNGSSVTLVTTGAGTDITDGQWHEIQVRITQNGADLDSELWIDGTQRATGTDTNITMGVITGAGTWEAVFGNSLGIVPGESSFDVCHITVHTDPDVGQFYDAMTGYAGETASARISRICAEEGIPYEAWSPAPSRDVRLGSQPVGTALEVMRDAELAGHGMLYELTSTWGLGYRPLDARYALSPAMTIDLSTYRVTGTGRETLQPVWNDQRLRNELTVRRPSGGEVRVQNAASIARYGRYDDSVTVNLESDGDLEQDAIWRLHLLAGGVRYAAIPIDLGANPSLLSDWLDIRLGHRIDRTSHPPQHPAETVSVILEGYSMTLRRRSWTVDAIVEPYLPWHVGVYADTTATVADNPSRYQITGCTTRAAFDTTTDSVLQVNTPEGEFTSDSTFLPFVIESAGAVMEVSAVSGSGAAQDLTVTVLNGVSKTIPTGSTVLLHRAARYGL